MLMLYFVTQSISCDINYGTINLLIVYIALSYIVK